jgi:hypothetical protein
MESWYNKFRWSCHLNVCVFNPLSVNMFVKTGEFVAHWTATDEPSPLFNKELFQSDVLRLFVVKDARVELHLRDLMSSVTLVLWQKGLTSEGQLSVLAAAGVVTIAPECGASSTMIPLLIPNFGSQAPAEQILRWSFERFVSVETKRAVEEYCRHGDPVLLIKALDRTEGLSQLVLDLAGTSKIDEAHVTGL